MRQDGARVEEDTVPTDWHDHWNSGTDELVSKVFDLTDAGPDVVVRLDHLANPLRQRLHVPA
jgi:hypothetical protein